MRAWIEIPTSQIHAPSRAVALFMRAWIEIRRSKIINQSEEVVALFMRAWIEIFATNPYCLLYLVALFMRAWIEISERRLRYSDRVVSPSS